MAESFLKKFLKKIKLNESAISTLLGALVIVVIGALVINYFKNIEKPSQDDLSAGGEQTQGEFRLVEENGELVPENLPATYQTEPGDSLWKIAERFYGSGYNWVDIAEENQLGDPDRISAGLNLNIPKKPVIKPEIASGGDEVGTISGSTYTVRKGDNLWGIAVRAYGDGYRWTEIARTNNLVNPGIIHAGNTLTIPR